MSSSVDSAWYRAANVGRHRQRVQLCKTESIITDDGAMRTRIRDEDGRSLRP